MIDRRDALKLALGSAAALASPALAQTPAKPRTRIIFLGTKGGPRVTMGASNPANLVIYGAHMPPLLEWLPRYILPSIVAIVATYVALRFTQRDALAAVLITGVNIIAGLIIGVFQHGLDLGTAAQTYTILTVGDYFDGGGPPEERLEFICKAVNTMIGVDAVAARLMREHGDTLRKLADE